METCRLPQQRPNLALKYAVPTDTDQHQDLFRLFNKYTDHLPTKNRLRDYIKNQQVAALDAEEITVRSLAMSQSRVVLGPKVSHFRRDERLSYRSIPRGLVEQGCWISPFALRISLRPTQ